MKIVAIGGGNNSDIGKNGLPQIYEQETIDREIITLTNLNNPNVLFVSYEEMGNFNKIVNTYGKIFNCPIKW